MLRRITIAALCLAATSVADATTVMVMSLERGRAQVIINGTVIRHLSAGQVSPEGVRLVRIDRDKAVVEVDGKELALGLGESTTAIAELKANRRGQFFTTALINGVATEALIDTGATSVAVSRDEAQRMAINLGGAPRVQVSTAGGPRFGYRVMLATVRVGAITLQNVEAIVMEGGRGELPITLIGMSFLNSVDMRRSGDTLTLSRRQF